MRRAILIVLSAGLVIGLSQSPARAIKPFLEEFKGKYVKPDGTDGDKEFAAKVEKQQCNVCHMGKSKKMRNDYGKALGKFVKKEDKDAKEKIQEALDKAAEEKSADGKTFGELIKEHQLPGGE
jgi:hypothetical protein